MKLNATAAIIPKKIDISVISRPKVTVNASNIAIVKKWNFLETLSRIGFSFF